MWSLVVEVQFYILLPIIFLLSKSASPKTCLWIVTVIFLGAPVATHFGMGFSPAFHPYINAYFPSGLDSFYLGVLIAGIENMKLLKKSFTLFGDIGFVMLLGIVFSAGCLALRHKPENDLQHYAIGWLMKIASGFLLCYVADPQNPRAKLLCNPALRWFGIISYEWYLFHQPVVSWARQSLGSASGDILKYALITGGSLVVSLTFSALAYRWYSLPILKYGRNKR